MANLFFGYAGSDPNVRDTIQDVSARLGRQANVDTSLTWEDLRVDGKLIINDIMETILNSTLCVFDVTSTNSNVLFELGIAIGAGKSVVITREENNAEADRLFRELALLTTTGYTPFLNADGLMPRLAQLVVSPPPPLLESMLGDSEVPLDETKLLYVPSVKEDQASRALSRSLDAYKGIHIERLELDEYGTQPLAWLAQEVYSSGLSLFHFTPSTAYLSDVSNRRASLLSGIAVGLERPMRIVIGQSEPVALDYRDLRIPYTDSRDIGQKADAWLSSLRVEESRPRRMRKHLSVELAALRFGNHVAEADAEGLDRYFVETRDYLDVVDGNTTIFTGRKGTGKTANMLQAATHLKQDARNIVCVIKPAAYELEALCELLARVPVSHIGTYLVEGIWKYLLYTEVASELVRQAEQTPAGIPADSPLFRVRAILEKDHQGSDASFSVRLESLIQTLGIDIDQESTVGSVETIAQARQRIGVALFGGYIKTLRELLTEALTGKRRVAILIDNLDKAWERGTDLAILSKVILGLLTAVGRVSDEFAQVGFGRRQDFRLTLTAFLRSDIFAYVRGHAREPDKIATSEIEWRNQSLLARVLEDRFMAARDDKSSPADLWDHYFVPELRGIPSKEFILSRIQPRPRDLVFFANSAVLHATNSKHSQVAEEDVESAEESYSQFAYEALVVEGLGSDTDMESALMSFVGEGSRVTEGELSELLVEGGVIPEAVPDVVELLRQLGFLGLETSPDVFDYGGTVGELRRADVLSKKLQRTARTPRRYEIHPAYRKYLAIQAG